MDETDRAVLQDAESFRKTNIEKLIDQLEDTKIEIITAAKRYTKQNKIISGFINICGVITILTGITSSALIGTGAGAALGVPVGILTAVAGVLGTGLNKKRAKLNSKRKKTAIVLKEIDSAILEFSSSVSSVLNDGIISEEEYEYLVQKFVELYSEISKDKVTSL